MPHVTCGIPVNASLKTIWNLLLDKIEHPERYIDGVAQTEILENTPERVLRRIHLGELMVTEEITLDEALGEIYFKLVEHPLFTGQVINRLLPPASPDGAPELVFEMDWQPQNEDARQAEQAHEEALVQSVRDAVQHTKELAERYEEQAARR